MSSDVLTNAISQLITEYVKAILDKALQGKKLSNQEYLILLVYYNVWHADKRFGELKDYVEKRLEDKF